MPEKKKGRPKSENKRIPMTVMVEEETKAKVAILAESMMVSPAIMLRWAVEGLIEVAECPVGNPVEIPKQFRLTRIACQENPEYFI